MGKKDYIINSVRDRIEFFHKFFNFNLVTKYISGNSLDVLNKIFESIKENESNNIDRTIFYYNIYEKDIEKFFNISDNVFIISLIDRLKHNIYCFNVNNEVVLFINFYNFEAVLFCSDIYIEFHSLYFFIFYLVNCIVPEIDIYIVKSPEDVNIIKIERSLERSLYIIKMYYHSEKRFNDLFFKNTVKYLSFEPSFSKIYNFFKLLGYDFYSFITDISLVFDNINICFLKRCGFLKNFNIGLLQNNQQNKTSLLQLNKNSISINPKFFMDYKISQFDMRKIITLMLKYFDFVKRIKITSEDNSEYGFYFFCKFVNLNFNKNFTVFIEDSSEKNIIVYHNRCNKIFVTMKEKELVYDDECNFYFYSFFLKELLSKKDKDIKFVVKRNRNMLIKYDSKLSDSIFYFFDMGLLYNENDRKCISFFSDLLKNSFSLAQKNVYPVFTL